MWREFKTETEVELGLIHRLLDEYKLLLETAESTPPGRVELLALCGVLQSFYNGIETILKRAEQTFSGTALSGASWHAQLLDGVSHPAASRPPLISAELRERLKPYLEFRHVFRHSYSFQVEWRRMAPLVLDCAGTLEQFEAELRRFFDEMAAGGTGDA